MTPLDVFGSLLQLREPFSMIDMQVDEMLELPLNIGKPLPRLGAKIINFAPIHENSNKHGKAGKQGSEKEGHVLSGRHGEILL